MERANTILIADDNKANRDLLAKMLTSRGYLVSEAGSGVEALEKIKKEVPDLVVLDVKMPDINGFEVCKKLMGNEVTEKIPIILVTSEEEFKEEKEMVKGLDAGALDYLLRPVSQEVLMARVRVGLRLRDAERKLEERHAELAKKYLEVKEMHDLMLDRELKMEELEKEIKSLKSQLAKSNSK